MGTCSIKKQPQQDVEIEKSPVKSTLEIPFKPNTSSLAFKFPIKLETTQTTLCEATHVPTDKPVFVKRLKKTKNSSKSVTGELEILNGLDHEGVVKVVDYFETEDHHFIVYEKINGLPIFEYLVEHKDKVSMVLLKSMIKKIIEAVSYLHINKIILRNLNPNHILFDGSKIVLINFRHAKKVDSYPLADAKKKGLKKTWTIPYLRAPETVKGRYNHKAEVWVVGALTYSLLTGQKLFQSNSEEKLLSLIGEADIDWSVQEMSSLHPIIVECLKGMLHKKFKKRIDLIDVLNYPWFNDNSGEQDIELSSGYVLGMRLLSSQSKYNDILVTMDLEKKSEPSEESALHSRFASFDVKGDGIISRGEAWKAIEPSHVLLNKQNFEEMFRKYDKDKSWTINYKELIKGIAERRLLMRIDDLKSFFHYCDMDRRGYILLSELDYILGIRLGNQEIRALFLEYASKGDRMKEDDFIIFTISC